jgi:hypothetical protein
MVFKQHLNVGMTLRSKQLTEDFINREAVQNGLGRQGEVQEIKEGDTMEKMREVIDAQMIMFKANFGASTPSSRQRALGMIDRL